MLGSLNISNPFQKKMAAPKASYTVRGFGGDNTRMGTPNLSGGGSSVGGTYSKPTAAQTDIGGRYPSGPAPRDTSLDPLAQEAIDRREKWKKKAYTNIPIPELVGIDPKVAQDPNFDWNGFTDWWYNDPEGFIQNPDKWESTLLEGGYDTGVPLQYQFPGSQQRGTDLSGYRPVVPGQDVGTGGEGGLSDADFLAQLQASNQEFMDSVQSQISAFNTPSVGDKSSGLSPELLAVLMQLGGNQQEEAPSYYYGPY